MIQIFLAGSQEDGHGVLIRRKTLKAKCPTGGWILYDMYHSTHYTATPSLPESAENTEKSALFLNAI